MIGALILPAWALAALGHGLLALDRSRAAERRAAHRALVVALALTALWALAVAGIGPRDAGTRLAEGARSLAWLGFMAALARRAGGRVAVRDEADRGAAAGARVALGAVYFAVAAVVVAATFLSLVEAASPLRAVRAVTGHAALLLRVMAAVSALVLTHHLHLAAIRGGMGRGAGLRLAAAALALLWGADLVTCAAAWMLGGWPAALVMGHGAATALLAAVMAVAAHRDGEWTPAVSRALAWRSLRAIGVAGAAALVLGGAALVGDLAGPAHARVAQTAWTLGSAVALLTLMATPASRRWLRVTVAKHLFRHRYDYRAEWLRFTDTLASDAGEPIGERVARAMAQLVDAPAALLLAAEDEALTPAAGWRWDGDMSMDADTVGRLAGGWIVDLDAGRAGQPEVDTGADRPDAWAVVPLIHGDRLAGAVVLARPPGGGALGWEELDLLRICGRHAASHVAEARAQDALAEARRFDEFSRRFAFIVHDVKNLASQVGLVARNAERHADDPAFRADMVATLRDAAERMNALLARLAHADGPGAARPAPTPLLALAEAVARRRRAQHVVSAAGDPDAWAMADAGRLERLLDHLVQNAVEASAPGSPVMIEVTRDEREAVVTVVDGGCGMTPAFVRGELFRAWGSTKPDGFGIGAFEARQLAQGMGGRVSVESRVGEGTRFAVYLPAAPVLEAAA